MVAAEKHLTSSHIAKDYIVIPVVRRYIKKKKSYPINKSLTEGNYLVLYNMHLKFHQSENLYNIDKKHLFNFSSKATSQSTVNRIRMVGLAGKHQRNLNMCREPFLFSSRDQ